MDELESDVVKAPANSRQAANVILIGLTGCGKSTIGSVLATKMNYGFLDLDDWVETTAAKSIADIFAESSEEEFRRLEKAAMARIKSIRNHVIAVGSGAVMDQDNWELLRALGTTVWLDCDPHEIARRLIGRPGEIAKRPLLSDLVNEEDRESRGNKLKERLTAILRSRSARFAQADIAVAETFSTPDESARRIKALIGQRNQKRQRDY